MRYVLLSFVLFFFTFSLRSQDAIIEITDLQTGGIEIYDFISNSNPVHTVNGGTGEEVRLKIELKIKTFTGDIYSLPDLGFGTPSSDCHVSWNMSSVAGANQVRLCADGANPFCFNEVWPGDQEDGVVYAVGHIYNEDYQLNVDLNDYSSFPGPYCLIDPFGNTPISSIFPSLPIIQLEFRESMWTDINYNTCDGSWSNFCDSPYINDCNPDPDVLMPNRSPLLITPSDALCKSESEELGDLLSWLMSNYYEITNYDSDFIYDFDIYENLYSYDPAVDFTIAFANQGFVVLDNTPNTFNHAVMITQGTYVGNYSYYNNYLNTTSSGGNPGWQTSCVYNPINSPCYPEDENNINTVTINEIAEYAFTQNNHIRIKETDINDLGDLDEIELEVEAVVEENNDKLIYDWFFEDSTGEVILLSSDNSVIYVDVPGNYFVKARAKNTLNLNTDADELWAGPSEFYVCSTDKIKIIDSSLEDPEIISLSCTPTPAYESISVKSEYIGNPSSSRLVIISSQGEIEVEIDQELEGGSGEVVMDVDISELQSGVYYVILILDEGVSTENIVIYKAEN